MRYLSRLSSFGFISTLLISVLSCQQLSPIEPAGRPRQLPKTIVYHAEGALAHLVYQSRFTYSADNQLLSIQDSLLSAPIAQQPAKPWVQFQYTNHRLSQIELPAISVSSDSVNQFPFKVPARYTIRYEDRYLLGQLIVGGRPVREARIELDAAGFPVKKQVRIGRLFLDGQGHYDIQAATKAGMTMAYEMGYRIVNEHYDTYANIFADSPAYQILDALLTSTNADIAVSTGLGGLDNALLTNNLLNRDVRWCDPKEKCGDTYTLRYETLQVNEWGFPTKRNTLFDAMGVFYYTITYTTVN